MACLANLADPRTAPRGSVGWPWGPWLNGRQRVSDASIRFLNLQHAFSLPAVTFLPIAKLRSGYSPFTRAGVLSSSASASVVHCSAIRR
jgi:hypothetical protein